MSRAFVKEESDAPPPPPLERPVSSAPNLVTSRGLRLIEAEAARLRSALAAAPDEAEAALLRRDLRYWTARRSTAQLVALDPAPAAAGFGARLVIRRGGAETSIAIVGEDEADPAAGLIAWTSPLARALDGAEPGDTVELSAGGRTEAVELIEVGPGEG
ncbi:MAG TPA: GreA/GreB family elongation factor [Allosphingosinicella sp.]|nr:GreA/GreB family elongation factor [Allosphingosinicella sp.]